MVDIHAPQSMAQNFANYIERISSARQGNVQIPGVDGNTVKQITDNAKSQDKIESVSKGASNATDKQSNFYGDQGGNAYSRRGTIAVGTNRVGGNINVSV